MSCGLMILKLEYLATIAILAFKKKKKGKLASLRNTISGVRFKDSSEPYVFQSVTII